MGKSKQKTHSEVEYLRGLIKSQKSEIRDLRKKLKVLSKKEHQFNSFMDDVIEEPFVKIEYELCECGKGTIEEVDLGMIIIANCKICGFRERRNRSSKDGKKGNDS